VLPHDLEGQIWLVMFDAEDNGHLEGWDWILGSSAFAESLAEVPDGVVVVDMIGDADLQIYLEINSDKNLRTDIWEQAASLGHADVFINEEKFSMLDDHTPFLRLGIPAVDIIDFDYPYWHTLSDTPNKVTADSLQIVGETLLAWLLSR
jgi:Zn-dependent M28 family amino/carboxypeptidase